MTELTEDLRYAAAVFIAKDPGSPGFLSRFAHAVTADAGLASRALDSALAARGRAGSASLKLTLGDLRVETTSSGARLTACAQSGTDGGLSVSLRLVDAGCDPVPGVAMRVLSADGERLAVTDPGGWASISQPGESLRIQLGTARQDEQASGGNVITLPRVPRERYQLAASHAPTGQIRDDPGRWQLTLGPVEFLCQERTGGYDLTLLVKDVPATFADSTAGAHGVRFATWNRNGHREDWLVPLAQRPLGLGGSLYGTAVDRIDRESVRLGHAEALVRSAEENLEDLISRSVCHSDADSAWRTLRQRLGPGRLRMAIETALTERENAR